MHAVPPWRVRTFEDNQDQAHVAQRQKGLLPGMLEDIRQRHTVDNAHGNLPDNPGADDLGGDPFCQRQEEKEGYDHEDLDDWFVLDGSRRILCLFCRW